MEFGAYKLFKNKYSAVAQSARAAGCEWGVKGGDDWYTLTNRHIEIVNDI